MELVSELVIPRLLRLTGNLLLHLYLFCIKVAYSLGICCSVYMIISGFLKKETNKSIYLINRSTNSVGKILMFVYKSSAIPHHSQEVRPESVERKPF
jgi:hypothetical protein